jgi:hypothetical protein
MSSMTTAKNAELLSLAPISGNWQLQPDLQWVVRPGAAGSNDCTRGCGIPWTPTRSSRPTNSTPVSRQLRWPSRAGRSPRLSQTNGCEGPQTSKSVTAMEISIETWRATLRRSRGRHVRFLTRSNPVCFLPIKERSGPRDKNRESQRHRRNGPHPAESPGTAHPPFA